MKISNNKSIIPDVIKTLFDNHNGEIIIFQYSKK